MGSHGHFPYPTDSNGKVIDTCEWRDADDIKAHKSDGDTALIRAIQDFDIVGVEAFEEALKAAGDDINKKDKFGFTALHLAIKSQLKPELVHRIIDQKECDVEATTRRGFTPLMIAAWKGDLGVCQRLLIKGVSTAAKDSGGRTVWGVAHDHYQEEVLELFKTFDVHWNPDEPMAFPPAPKWRPENREDSTGSK